MADKEGDAVAAPVVVPEPEPDATGAQVTEGARPMDIMTAVKEVLRGALVVDGLARGLREAAKALDRRQAHMALLAANCEDAQYPLLITALCSEQKIPLLTVPDNKQLGEWAGLCKIDADGHARKVVPCSCVVIKDFGRERTAALDFLLEYVKTNNKVA